MRVGGREVAGGLSKRSLFFDAGANKEEVEEVKDKLAPAAELPGVEAIAKIKTLTEEDIGRLCERFKWALPIGERLIVVRYPEMEVRKFTRNDGQASSLWSPTMSEYRQNRVAVLASGPDATVRVRLPVPLRNGDTKLVVDLLPTDVIEVGIYAMGERPTALIQDGDHEILVCNARDVTDVTRSREVARIIAEDVAASYKEEIHE